MMLNALPTTGQGQGPGIPLRFTDTTRHAWSHDIGI
jgi:hypothetical protein